MHIFELVLIAIGLAADSFAVAVSRGAVIERMRLHHALRLALFFSFFQALMPWIGWHVGRVAGDALQAVDHWVAFVLLCAIGGKMIYESHGLNEEQQSASPLGVMILTTLAIATSIDALVVGFSFSFLDIAIIMPVLIIGLVTFIFSVAGAYIGTIFGRIFEDKVELVGGLILIAIGCRILFEHLTSS